jgi:Flp pilus assembly protein TadG
LSFLGGESGQAMVEFAFVLPVLVFVTLAAVNFGIIVKDSISNTNAARIAGRAAAVARFTQQPGYQGVRAAIDDAMTNQPGDATFTCSDSDQCDPGSRVTVTVRQPWTFTVPFLGNPLSGTLTSDVTENVE